MTVSSAGPTPSAPARRRIRTRTLAWDSKTYDIASWRDSASCRDVDADFFFPAGSAAATAPMVAAAKAICARCPVRQECLNFAVTTMQEFGIWGGYDEEERKHLRRSRPPQELVTTPPVGEQAIR